MVVKTQPKRTHRRLKRNIRALLTGLVAGLIIGCLIGSTAQGAKLKAQAQEIEDLKHELEIVEKPITIQYISAGETEEEYYDGLELLANLVEAEAGDQDFDGKCLVVDVVLNRVKSEDFPNTITEVIMQKNQFTSVWDGGLDRAGWRMQDEDYKAVIVELQNQLNEEVLYFTADNYGKYGTPAFKHGDHYFCTE